MSDYVKLAAALGFSQRRAYPKAPRKSWHDADGVQIEVSLDSVPVDGKWATLKTWFNSAEGQRMVEDRVDELWLRETEHLLPPRVARYKTNSLTYIELQVRVSGGWIEDKEAAKAGITDDCAALIWLHEREKK